ISAAFRRSRLSSRYTGCPVTGFSAGTIVVTYLATLDPSATNETASTIQAAIQQQLFVNGTGTFLGQYHLQGTRQTALTFEDYDECNPASSIHIQDCGTGATCTNEVGTYSCQCSTGYEGTPPGCTAVEVFPPLHFVNDDDAELVKWLMVFVIVFLSICFLVTFVVIIAICRTLSHAGKYVPEEDEISMGRVTSIATPKYEERQVMREYYS
ncbi:63 kDa sperm flagellar membrane -like, partial [Paramuricea clavata]